MTLSLNTIHVGDCRELLGKLPDDSVNCVVTSPPYWGLRDYGTATWEGGDAACEHRGRVKPRQDTTGGTGGRFSETRGEQPAKAFQAVPVKGTCRCGAVRVDQQIGLEETPQQYVETMVMVFREVRRVLRADGTLWLNLGDCYAQGGRGGIGDASTLDGTRRNQNESRSAQQAMGGLRSPPDGFKAKDLIGIPWRVAFALQAAGWWLRADIVWAKPNPMPESVKDRPTKAHEYLFLLTKAERYYYDADAIREPHTEDSLARVGRGRSDDHKWADGGPGNQTLAADISKACHPNGRNRRSVWTIPTQPFPESHFATFPEDLVTPCILAGCPLGGVVLDPFGGSGTVARVAEDLGRRWVLFDLNPEYAAMARRRMSQQGLLGRLSPAAVKPG